MNCAWYLNILCKYNISSTKNKLYYLTSVGIVQDIYVLDMVVALDDHKSFWQRELFCIFYQLVVIKVSELKTFCLH